MLTRINVFTLSEKILFIFWKKNSASPTRKPKDLAVPNKKSNLESIHPYLLYHVQQYSVAGVALGVLSGSKTLAWGFAMALHRLHILV